MNFTTQQKLIIFSDLDEIYVSARAGSGKTTTLLEFSRHRSLQTFLYIVYNNPVKKEAKRKFFGNTKVHTIHSLAYQEFGFLYKDKLTNNLKPIEIIKAFDDLKEQLKKDPEETYKTAHKIIEMLTFFFNSKLEGLEELESINPEINKYAKEYWSNMQKLKSPVLMTQDGYLKLFHLTKPILNYDYIMVDEAQDSNEVMLDIVMSQKAKKIFVGDVYQEIYGYRNTVNIFKERKDMFFLTDSFRFGEQIAFVANQLLKKFKNETKLVNGKKEKDEITIFNNEDHYTIITRTNAKIFDLALNLIKENKTIHIVGGENFVFDEILDAYYLYVGDRFKIKSLYLKEFKTFEKLKKIAEEVEDIELKFLVKIVEKYNRLIPDAIDQIKRYLSPERFAEIILTTAHKSKGREFFNVKISDDFVPLTKNDKIIPYHKVNQEEINIYYVAVTRAMEKIQINKDLNLFLVS